MVLYELKNHSLSVMCMCDLADCFHVFPSPQQEKNRKRGKNKISAKLRRKQKNVIDAQLLKLKDKQAADRVVREESQALRAAGGVAPPVAAAGSESGSSANAFAGALSRFYKK